MQKSLLFSVLLEFVKSNIEVENMLEIRDSSVVMSFRVLIDGSICQNVCYCCSFLVRNIILYLLLGDI